MFPGKHPFLKALPVELPGASGTVAIVILRNRTIGPARGALHQDRTRGHDAAGEDEMMFRSPDGAVHVNAYVRNRHDSHLTEARPLLARLSRDLSAIVECYDS